MRPARCHRNCERAALVARKLFAYPYAGQYAISFISALYSSFAIPERGSRITAFRHALSSRSLLAR
eukprot:2920095-Rhodomonas_salina.1